MQLTATAEPRWGLGRNKPQNLKSQI